MNFVDTISVTCNLSITILHRVNSLHLSFELPETCRMHNTARKNGRSVGGEGEGGSEGKWSQRVVALLPHQAMSLR